MSNLKISNDLFLGNIELKRLVQFLRDDGFRRLLQMQTWSYGVASGSVELELPNQHLVTGSFKVAADTTPGTVKIAQGGLAIDKDGEIIFQSPLYGYAIPNDGVWYYMMIAHEANIFEEGTVSVDVNGNMTGTNTAFLSALRGMPDFPSKIRFYDDIAHVGVGNDVEVLEVIDNTNAILQGDFSGGAINSKRYSIVGTFTPGVTIPSGDEEIFEFDSCSLSLVAGIAPTPIVGPGGPPSPDVPTLIDVVNELMEADFTYPAVPTEGKYFYIAAVMYDGSSLMILDCRKDYRFKLYIDEKARYCVKADPDAKTLLDYCVLKAGTLNTFDVPDNKLILNSNGNIFSVSVTGSVVIKSIAGFYIENTMIYLKVTSAGGTVALAAIADGGKFTNSPANYGSSDISGRWLLLRKTANSDEWDLINYSDLISVGVQTLFTNVADLVLPCVSLTSNQILASVSPFSNFSNLFTSVAAGSYFHYKKTNKILTISFSLQMVGGSGTFTVVQFLYLKLPENFTVATGKVFKGSGWFRNHKAVGANEQTVWFDVFTDSNSAFIRLYPLIIFQGASGSSFVMRLSASGSNEFAMSDVGSANEISGSIVLEIN